jgi:hypothetical protein
MRSSILIFEQELAKELAEQDVERKKLEGMSQREREMKMLEGIMVRGANEERVDEAIEMIMHDRHAEETASLITAQYEERTRVIRKYSKRRCSCSFRYINFF